jgi:REP element-mobilizing transposase RayT
MCEHIVTNASDKGFFIDAINGYHEHMHVLMLLRPQNSISKQMQLIKGESAHWANETGFIQEPFAWADKYFAASVSGRQVPSVREYIKSQQQHHAKVSFAEEFNHFLNSAGYTAQLSQG